ncbi:MAG TPA: serine/threonine-protein kinase [Burkholderiaceae bacterium]|nr:serine/threonine-protein kinase [Burkholderiaceae bacterium]
MITDRELTAANWHRLNELLASALELDEEQREAWLAALPAEASDLRPLLAELLTQGGATGLGGTSQTLQPVVALAAQAMAGMRREQAGDRIGPWQLERLLAEGGMGAVWEAARADGVMQRRAALKLPRAEWVDHGLAGRIARERAILARLQHPAIAVLFDAGLADGSRPYLALEYVDGVPIDAWCAGRELKQILRLMVQVIRAVAYAHGQLVIHRDLKPANVLVTAEGAPKLLDFGISKLIEGDAPAAESTALTRLAGRPMTLAYAAPEQLLALPVTVAADVYALGVMLFELASGSRLYQSTEPRAMEAELLRGDLRRPSDAAADPARARALRGDLDAIIGTALKRQPQERYDSAAALADDLERYLDGKPVRARPDRTGYRLKKFVARNTLAVGAAGAVVLALALGLGLALWQGNEARQQAQRATALNTFVLGLIRTADPNASAQTKAADVAMLNTIEQRIDSEFQGAPDQLLQLRVTVGEAYKNRGEMMAARRVFQKAVEEAAPRLPSDNLMLLTARVQAADPLLLVSIESARDLEAAIESLRTKGAAGAEVLMSALLTHAELQNRFGVPRRPTPESLRATLQEAQDVALRTFGAGSPQHLKAVEHFVRVGPRPNNRSELNQRIELLAAALEQGRQRGSVTDTPAYRATLSLYGLRLCESDRVSEGLESLWSVMMALQKSHDSTSSILEHALVYIGSCLGATGDPEGAWYLARAFDVAAARETPASTNLMRRAEDVLYGMLTLYRFTEASKYLRHAFENAVAIPEPELRARFVNRLIPAQVHLLAFTGATEEAEKIGETFAARLATDPSARTMVAEVWLPEGLVFAQRQNGRYNAAIATAQRAEQRFTEAKWDELTGVARAWRAAALLDAGQVPEALTAAVQAMELKPHFVCDPQDDDVRLVYGRALLLNGRAAEALEPLRLAYGCWLGLDAKSVWAAEAEYWFGRAWIANGEQKRGRWMVAEARKVLATSPLPLHRALAALEDGK